MEAGMKHLFLALAAALLAGCAGMDQGTSGSSSTAFHETSGGTSASARNLCEVMRSFDKYDPGDCRSR
jgi:outer membrane biogenesis lipoprotein LolB